MEMGFATVFIVQLRFDKKTNLVYLRHTSVINIITENSYGSYSFSKQLSGFPCYSLGFR